MLLTKAAINHRFFSVKSGVSEWIQEIPTVLSHGTFTLQPYGNFFLNFLSEVEKCIMWSSIQVLPSQVSKKKSSYTFEDIDLRESHAKLHKRPSGTLGADPILRLEISIYCLNRNFN